MMVARYMKLAVVNDKVADTLALLSDKKLPNDNILLQRIIAGTTIRVNNKITFSAHLQDSGAFGWSLANAKEPDAFKHHQENSPDPFYIMNPQEEFFDLYDANHRIDSVFQIISIIAGRQKIAYGDYRTFGPSSW